MSGKVLEITRLKQVVLQRIAQQVNMASHVHLVQNMRLVRADSFDAQRQLMRDVRQTHALNNAIKNLKFPVAQFFMWRFLKMRRYV